MNEKNPDINRLNYAIATLNGDAEDMHSLIEQSTDELKRATAESKRTVDLADEALKTIAPLADRLQETVEGTKSLMSETGKTMDKLTADVAQAQEANKEALGSLASDLERAQEANKDAFESFTSESLKASDKTRDALQTDLLSHKTATMARMDSFEAATSKRLDTFEAEVIRLGGTVDELGKSLGEKTDALQKKVVLPLYGVIAVAVLQLITLVALFIK